MSDSAMKRTWRLLFCVGITGVASASGYFLNATHIAHLENLWLGRTITLPIAVAFGPIFGLVAATFGALSAQGSDTGLFTLFIAEGLLLGLVTRRRRSSLAGRAVVAALLVTSVAAFPGLHGLPALTVSTIPLAIQRALVLLVAPVASEFVTAGLWSLSIRFRLAEPSPHRTPLRTQILHASILVAMLPLLVVNVISGEIFLGRHEAEVEARLKDTSMNLADRFNAYLESHMAAVGGVAASMRGSAPTSGGDELLIAFKLLHPDFRTLGLAAPDGTVLKRQSDIPGGGLTLAERPFFIEALAAKRIVISDVNLSRLNGDQLVFLCAPAVDAKGQVSTVAYGSLRLDAFANFVEPYITLPNSTVVVLDRSNKVIYSSPGMGYVGGKDLTNSPMVRGADSAPIESNDTGIPGASSVYAYDPTGTTTASAVQLASRGIIATTGWTVYVQQPQVLLASEMPAYFVVTLGFVLAALGGSVIGARQFARAVTNPLEDMVGFVGRLSVDSADAVLVPANAPVEISTLAHGVSHMQERLRESYSQLEQALAAGEVANRKLEHLASTLEVTVDKRTADLANTTQFLENVLTALPGALFVSDAAGIVRLCNEAASTLTGRSAADLTGLPLSAVLEAHAHSAVTTGKAELNLVTATGERIPMLVSSASLDSHDRSSGAGAIYIAIDIRDRKQLEMELQQAQKLESVGRLAAGVAHEINTPAQFVSDSVQFLKEGLTDLLGLISKYRALHQAVVNGTPTKDLVAEVEAGEHDADLEYLVENVPGAIERSIDGLSRVTTIVKSMKEFAHPDQKEMTMIDLNQGIESTLIIARNEYKYVADVVTDFHPLPPVRCHGGDVNQVVLNIVINAAHAISDVVGNSQRRGRITVETRQEDEYAVIRIGDTGGGIPEAVRDRVFDPFFTTKGVGKGTGQGLAIARTIVEKHQGQFTFETAMGEGTTFTVRLPLDGPRASDMAA